MNTKVLWTFDWHRIVDTGRAWEIQYKITGKDGKSSCWAVTESFLYRGSLLMCQSLKDMTTPESLEFVRGLIVAKLPERHPILEGTREPADSQTQTQTQMSAAL